MDRKRCWKREGPLFESVEGIGPKQIVTDAKPMEETRNGLAATHAHMANMNRERCQFWWEDEGPLADTEQLVPVTFRGMGQELDMLSGTALVCRESRGV